ncbi:MAG TPA: RsmE family RNA methyltransferase [Opitutaceae bacterium]|nr:RsmE family RNA methyltransferase [Opitutaceae bacterium]
MFVYPRAILNLILFESHEIAAPLPRADPRARHLLDVLRRREGDPFDAGLINGPRGKGRLEKITPATLTFTFAWGEPPPPLDPIMLFIGLPRPQTARKILQEATALGVGALHFFTAEKAEPSYARSTLWTSGEWRRHLVAGAEQAFCTRLPELTHGLTLAAALEKISPAATRLALDNYEAPTSLGQAQSPAGAPVVLALGSERGWSAAERDFLRAKNFSLVHLGSRVLRTETAVVAAVALVKARLGLY